MYPDLVYQLGKRYRQERERNPDIEFPFFKGTLADLVDPSSLPELQGEHVIVYTDSHGTNHFIHVYFEQDIYEAEGMPPSSNGFSMSSDVGRFEES